jgi:MFS-type transporter involved in bile tolerance (Atg22 family)
MSKPQHVAISSRASKSEIFAWTLYDWANSAYSAMSITILVYYIRGVLLPGNAGTLAWTYGIGLSMLVAACLSPILGALADANRSKRRWLAATALCGASAATLIFFIPLDLPWLVVALFVLTSLGFELSLGIYNGFLPEIVDEENMNRVSAWGFGLGYIGGGLALAIGIVILGYGQIFGLPNGTPLTQDVNFTSQGQFAVEVPPGEYDVTLWLGDVGRRRPETHVLLQGEEVDLLEPGPAGIDRRTYRIEVAAQNATQGNQTSDLAPGTETDPASGEESIGPADDGPTATLTLELNSSSDASSKKTPQATALAGMSIVATAADGTGWVGNFDFGTLSSPVAEQSIGVMPLVRFQRWLLKEDKNVVSPIDPSSEEGGKANSEQSGESTQAGIATPEDNSAQENNAAEESLPALALPSELTFGWTEGEIRARDAVLPIRLRIGILIMGLWWGLFTIPTLLMLKDRGTRPEVKEPFFVAAKEAVRSVGRTLRNVRRFPTLALFLVAFLIYNDGVQTVISQASIFAIETLGMPATSLILVILLIQFAALPGALVVGKVAEVFGQKRTLIGCIVIWVGVLIAAFFVQTVPQFWVMAGFVALVLGGTQSVSRAIMGSMTPERHSAEFFGFYNLSGKATSFAGPMLFGGILVLTGSAHWAIVSLLIFFLIGGVLILPLNIARGRETARADNLRFKAGPESTA